MGLWDKFNAPTPAKWRRIGNALLYSCGAIGAAGLFGFDELKDIFTDKELKWIIGVTLIIGFVSKFLTSFFSTDNSKDIKPS